MSTPLTPDTVQVGDRVVATKKMEWTQMIPPALDFVIEVGELGTVMEVNRKRWFVFVEWDSAPVRTDGKKQRGALHYMPKTFPPSGWDIEKI